MSAWQVICECGHVVEDLAREAADQFASQHQADGHSPHVWSYVRREMPEKSS